MKLAVGGKGLRVFSIAIACTCTVLLCAQVKSMCGNSLGSTVERKLAVVFKVLGEGRRLVGVSANPVEQKPTKPPRSAGPGLSMLREGYEIWFAKSGTTKGYWLDSVKGSYGVIVNGRYEESVGKDQFDLRRIAASAVMPTRAIPDDSKLTTPPAVADHPEPPHSLARLVSKSLVIAVGQVVGISRQGHTPLNSPYQRQHSVFVLAVDTYLKGGVGALPIVKVINSGGDLPWREPGSELRGVGFRIGNDPLLDVGERYILFLTLPGYPEGRRSYEQTGYVPAMVHGIQGKVAELDEFMPVDPVRAKLLLRNGIVSPLPNLDDIAARNWQFAVGPQVMNLREGDAIAAIRQAVAGK